MIPLHVVAAAASVAMYVAPCGASSAAFASPCPRRRSSSRHTKPDLLFLDQGPDSITACNSRNMAKCHSRSRISSSMINGDTTTTTVAASGMTSENQAILSEIKISPRSGLYQIETQEQHSAFLKAHPDKLVVIKFYANFCRACKALEPKFLAVKNDPQLTNLPIVWAEFASSRTNKDFFKSLEVLSLPTVHFYDGPNGLVENFQCAPANVPLLKKKLAAFLNSRVDPDTLQLKDAEVVGDGAEESRQAGQARAEREISYGNVLITNEHLKYLRSGLPFFQDLTDGEFDGMLRHARLLTFNPGDLIIKQGEPGNTFYVMKSGVAEMSVKSRTFDGPISTPPNYLGAVVNQLGKFDYFGERALSTGEPYCASVRVLEKTRCFAFSVDHIPERSILSRKRRASQEVIEQLNERYVIPKDYASTFPPTAKDEQILELLVRFKQIRQAAKCFEYMIKTELDFGNRGDIVRRSMLVSKLGRSQIDDYQDIFNLVDANGDGKLSLYDMHKFMESGMNQQQQDGQPPQPKEYIDLASTMNRYANPYLERYVFEYGISLDEFMGYMAEVTFYELFTEMFQELDHNNTGYVCAGDLDTMLGGVRDLIGDDNHKSIIDVDDKDVQVDYEQFSKMLLGAAL